MSSLLKLLSLSLVFLYTTELSSQNYEVSGNFIYPQINGIYEPLGMEDGVTSYKHQTQNVYIFRFGGVFWLIADSPSISANILFDIYDSGSIILNAPPLGAWSSGSTVALPVELSSFKAEVINRAVILHWKTVSETNNWGFELERSADGKVFQTLDFIAGSGTTTKQQFYTFTDRENLTSDSYYYRLKQLDFDGAFVYSNLLAVELDMNYGNEPKVFPNPLSIARQNINLVNLPHEIRLIRLLDSQGQMLETWHNEFSKPLDIGQLIPGTYILQIISASKNYSIKLLKI